MSAKHIAFGYVDRTTKRVDLFCEVHRRFDTGVIEFYVINGCWWGRYNPWTGNLEVRMSREGAPNEGKLIPAKVLWRGTYPFDAYDYNEAIGWIEDFAGAPLRHRLKALWDVIRDLPNYRLTVRIKRVERPVAHKAGLYEMPDLDDEIPF